MFERSYFHFRNFRNQTIISFAVKHIVECSPLICLYITTSNKIINNTIYLYKFHQLTTFLVTICFYGFLLNMFLRPMSSFKRSSLFPLGGLVQLRLAVHGITRYTLKITRLLPCLDLIDCAALSCPEFTM